MMRSTLMSLLFVLWVNLAALSAVPSNQTHPFSVHDMLAMDRLSDPQISPDSKWIVFVLRVTDLEANKGQTDLWLLGADVSSSR